MDVLTVGIPSLTSQLSHPSTNSAKCFHDSFTEALSNERSLANFTVFGSFRWNLSLTSAYGSRIYDINWQELLQKTKQKKHFWLPYAVLYKTNFTRQTVDTVIEKAPQLELEDEENGLSMPTTRTPHKSSTTLIVALTFQPWFLSIGHLPRL